MLAILTVAAGLPQSQAFNIDVDRKLAAHEGQVDAIKTELNATKKDMQLSVDTDECHARCVSQAQTRGRPARPR